MELRDRALETLEAVGRLPHRHEEGGELEGGPGGPAGGAVDTLERIAALEVEIEEIQRQQQWQQRSAEERVAAKRQLRQELILANSVLV